MVPGSPLSTGSTSTWSDAPHSGNLSCGASVCSTGGSESEAEPVRPARSSARQGAGSKRALTASATVEGRSVRRVKKPRVAPILSNAVRTRKKLPRELPVRLDSAGNPLPLTKEEQIAQKKLLRKIRNRESAERSRRKRLDQVAQLEQRIKALEEDKKSLERTNRSLLNRLQAVEGTAVLGKKKRAKKKKTQKNSLKQVQVGEPKGVAPEAKRAALETIAENNTQTFNLARIDPYFQMHLRV